MPRGVSSVKVEFAGREPRVQQVEIAAGRGFFDGVAMWDRGEGRTKQHEALATLRVLQPEKDDYEGYRKTQAQLIKSPFVFKQALRQPGIAELPTLAGEKDPVAWLVRHVEATAPRDAETIQVRLRGEHADDVTRIVDAITTAYLTEVVQKERRERIEHDIGLEKARQQATKSLLAAREAVPDSPHA